MCWPVVSWRWVVSEGCWDVVPGSYPACVLVLLLQQMNELTKALLYHVHVVHRASLQNPALASCQRFQLKIFLYLCEKLRDGERNEAQLGGDFLHYQSTLFLTAICNLCHLLPLILAVQKQSVALRDIRNWYLLSHYFNELL